MTDQELIIDALEQAQSILAECIEPGARRRPEFAINQLLHVLDRRNLACMCSIGGTLRSPKSA